jgi:hypothetical protein
MSIDVGLARKSYPDRINTDNKVQLESGDYAVHVHDVWIYYVDIDGAYTKSRDQAVEQRCKFTLTLDDTQPIIALGFDVPVRIGKNTFYSKIIEKMSGIADRDDQTKYDPKKLVGVASYATIEFSWNRRKKAPYEEYPWSKVTELRLREVQVKKPQPVTSTGAVPAARPANGYEGNEGWPSDNDRLDDNAALEDDEIPF